MMQMLHFPVVLALSSLPTGSVLSPSVGPTSMALAQFEACATATADLTTTLGPKEDREVLSSAGINYSGAARACKRFIADFIVAPNASPATQYAQPNFTMGGGYPGARSKAACNNTQLLLSTYEKAVGGGSFVLRSNAVYVGQWMEGNMFSMCHLKRSWGTNPPEDTPNPAGQETWRVVVSETANNFAVPVTAELGFIPD